ncbi:hypothetical protein PR048_025281 [Dryococelus australis]|uniref:Uncharacterized protein n=1 Tax=Dryococelus australis TaxID=614101 RepID=A0ABQ9GQZ5_9NEOP|nr:hypothetical protein PR048_025281 [Dryococelus australis]
MIKGYVMLSEDCEASCNGEGRGVAQFCVRFAASNKFRVVKAVRLEHCTPIQSYALRGDCALGVCGSVALIVPVLLVLRRGRNLQLAEYPYAEYPYTIVTIARLTKNTRLPRHDTTYMVRSVCGLHRCGTIGAGDTAGIHNKSANGKQSCPNKFAAPTARQKLYFSLRRAHRDTWKQSLNMGLVPCRLSSIPAQCSNSTWLHSTCEQNTCEEYQRGRSQISACMNRAGRCRWSAGFLRDLTFPSPSHSGAAPRSPHFTLIGSQDFDFKSR